MSASTLRSQLDRKNKARADAEKQAGTLRVKESAKRAAATKARASANRSRNATTIRSRMREAARHEEQANTAGRDASALAVKAAKYLKEASVLATKLASAERAEREAVEQEQQVALRRAASQQVSIEGRLSTTEVEMSMVLRELRAPKPEKLRVLMLGAAASGDLRVGREQSRIRTAVERALHRDLVELDAHPAATAEHLLDGLSRFRPHVVHFSGHSAQDLIVFEEDADQPHEGAIITAKAFARAIGAADEPPLLVVLNSCHSASQAKNLIDTVPFAIGMSDTIGDTDAITYAARFYASVADGQSIQAAHALGQAAVELAGLPDYDLPTLNCVSDVDPKTTFLVTPPQ